METCSMTLGTQVWAQWQPRGAGWRGSGRDVQVGGDLGRPIHVDVG